MEEPKDDDEDKPYDPEEDFDLDLELEKPIDDKKVTKTTPDVSSSQDASSTKNIENQMQKPTEKMETSLSAQVPHTTLKGGGIPSTLPTPQGSGIPSTLPTPQGSGIPSTFSTPQRSGIPLLGAASSSTPPVTSLPLSILMPISTGATTSSSAVQSLPVAKIPQLPIPSSELAGIVKLLQAVRNY